MHNYELDFIRVFKYSLVYIFTYIFSLLFFHTFCGNLEIEIVNFYQNNNNFCLKT